MTPSATIGVDEDRPLLELFYRCANGVESVACEEFLAWEVAGVNVSMDEYPVRGGLSEVPDGGPDRPGDEFVGDGAVFAAECDANATRGDECGGQFVMVELEPRCGGCGAVVSAASADDDLVSVSKMCSRVPQQSLRFPLPRLGVWLLAATRRTGGLRSTRESLEFHNGSSV